MTGKNAKIDTKPKEFLFKKCPLCQCQEILKLDDDTICLNCDWNSAQMEVSSGNFEKRLALSSIDTKTEKPIRAKSKILHLGKQDSFKDSESQVFALAACE